MRSVVVMGDPKLLNIFNSLCCAVVVVRKCPKALNAHEFCGIESPIVRIPLNGIFFAIVLIPKVNVSSPVN
jgi:hypothetical protein